MKFEVRYPGGAVHEVVIEGASRRRGARPLLRPRPERPQVLAAPRRGGGRPRRPRHPRHRIANGIFVNDKKTERSPLEAGDVFRIGDVEVTILGAAGARARWSWRPDGLGSMAGRHRSARPPCRRWSAFPPPPPGARRRLPPPHPAAASRAAPGRRPRHRRRPAARASRAPARPLTVTVLAVLWLLSIPFYAVVGIALAQALPGAGGMGSPCFVAAVAPGRRPDGLRAVDGARAGRARPRSRWPRSGILNCPFTLASIAVLAYMLRAARAAATSPAPAATPTADQSEAVFAAAVVAAVVLGGLDHRRAHLRGPHRATRITVG